MKMLLTVTDCSPMRPKLNAVIGQERDNAQHLILHKRSELLGDRIPANASEARLIHGFVEILVTIVKIELAHD
jgi:hypothetical protein